ncbi:MAG: hypothetical protein ACR2NA_10085 [Solirubrobacterales bacterium]
MVAANPRVVSRRYRGYRGRRALVTRQRVEFRGGDLLPVGEAYSACRRSLERGEVCALSFDVVGKYKLEFAGRPVGVRTGAARLALETGAPIVPAFMGRKGRQLYVRYEEPLEPDDFGELESLMRRLAEVVGDKMFERPAECRPTQFLKRMVATSDEHGGSPTFT